MESFVSIENNRINYKHGTFQQILEEMSFKLEYLNTVWKYFEWEKVNFNRWIAENIKEETPKEQKENVARLEFKIQRLFPHNFLSTNLIQLYTIFESKLGYVCDFCQTHFEVNLSEEEQRKLKRTKDNFLWLKYILKYKNIDIDKLNPYYNEIKQFQKLRNSIAHLGDRIAISQPNDNSFRNFLNRMEGIMIENSFWVQEGGMDTYLIVTDYPCKRFFNVSLDFFSFLLDFLYPSTKNKLREDG